MDELLKACVVLLFTFMGVSGLLVSLCGSSFLIGMLSGAWGRVHAGVVFMAVLSVVLGGLLAYVGYMRLNRKNGL